MSTATTAPPADVLAEVAALGLDADEVTATRSPRRNGRTFDLWRVWNAAGDLVAGTCRDCRALHRAEDLVRHWRMPGGRDLRCSACNTAALAERYAADPEAERERNRRYRRENAEAERERDRRYHRENAEVRREYYRARRARLAARTDAEILADREAAHPDGVKECEACRRSRPFEDFFAHRSTLDGLRRWCRPCTAEADRRRTRRRVEVLHPGASRCYICRAGPFEEVEHVLPRRYGGDDSPANLAPACEACNGAKYRSDPRDFLAERMGLEESWEFLRERLPASLLIGEPLGDFAARRAEAPLDLDEDDEQPAPAPATSTGRDGFHVLDVEAILGDAHRAA